MYVYVQVFVYTYSCSVHNVCDWGVALFTITQMPDQISQADYVS